MMLRQVVFGTAIGVLALLLLASVCLMVLAAGAIVADLTQPTDYRIGQAMRTVGLLMWTPVAIVSAFALRCLWRRRKLPTR